MRLKMKHFPISDAQHGEFILSVMKVARDCEELCRPKCSECKEPLTDDEIMEAKQEKIKNPICNDCLQDFFGQRLEERKHPDSL